MIIDYSRDGEKFDCNKLKENGFILHENDFRKKSIRNKNNGEPTGEYETVFNFVGFLINNKIMYFLYFLKILIYKISIKIQIKYLMSYQNIFK